MAYKFQKVDNIDIEQDPVRPELSLAFRNSKTRGREIYALVNDKGEYASIVCIAHCKFIPKSVDELKKFSDPTGNIAIAYTVWSHTKGAGKTIIDHLLKMARDSKQTKRVLSAYEVSIVVVVVVKNIFIHFSDCIDDTHFLKTT